MATGGGSGPLPFPPMELYDSPHLKVQPPPDGGTLTLLHVTTETLELSRLTPDHLHQLLEKILYLPIALPPETSPCWVWSGDRNSNFYGLFKAGPKLWKTHRLVYQLYHYVQLLPSQHLLHSCHNRLCCSPIHLRVGSHAENMKDKVAAGRAFRPKGENNGRHRITATMAEFIRTETQYDEQYLSALAGISVRQVRRIRRGESWSVGR